MELIATHANTLVSKQRRKHHAIHPYGAARLEESPTRSAYCTGGKEQKKYGVAWSYLHLLIGRLSTAERSGPRQHNRANKFAYLGSCYLPVWIVLCLSNQPDTQRVLE